MSLSTRTPDSLILVDDDWYFGLAPDCRRPAAENTALKHKGAWTPPDVSTRSFFPILYRDLGHVIQAYTTVKMPQEFADVDAAWANWVTYQRYVHLIPSLHEDSECEHFTVDSTSYSGFLYNGCHDLCRDPDLSEVREPLNTHWWLYPAARHYWRVKLNRPWVDNPVAAILFG